MSELTFAAPQRANAPPAAAKETVSLQRQETNLLETNTLQQWQHDTLTGTFAEPRIGFDFSGVPALTRMARRTQPIVQRPQQEETAASGQFSNYPEMETGLNPSPAEPVAESAASAEVPPAGLIMEDSAADLTAGQLRKSDFLSQLRIAVTLAAEEAMKGTGRTTEDCPYLEYWFGFYNRKDSSTIERAIQKYAPETTTAGAAGDYIPIIAARVRRSVDVWARSGEITGIPEGISMGLPGMGRLDGVGRVISGRDNIFFKARNGGARQPDDPRAIQAELGEGRPLEGSVRSRMESAFGMDFSHVRAHTDTAAAGLSARMNAHAFAVGEHVAFGANEYKPGTIVGDALIAHELAHVLQQGGSSDSVAPMELGNAHPDFLETDADQSAVSAMTSLYSKDKKNVPGMTTHTVPQQRTGLRLQRCSVFSELSSQRYQGYDASINPNGLVVPVGGTRDVGYNKKGDTMTIASINPAIATVTENPGIMTVSGVAHGATKINAEKGSEIVEQLDVSVRKQINKTVDYHFMSDSATPPHKTSRSVSDADTFTSTLNRVWEKQANIHFNKGVVDSKQASSDLGPEIVAPLTNDPEWLAITKFATGGDYNVFLVWEVNTAPGPDNAEGATGGKGGDTLLEDNACSDGLTIAHEAGHFLGLYNNNPHPDKGVMGGCGSSDRQRVYKKEADHINP